MHRGDLVFITEPGRFTPAAAEGPTGVVTAATGSDVGYRTFGGPGSVVVYDDPGRGGPPIIHRAEFYVEDGENWFDRANPEYVSAESCRELRNCPAPHAGFITKGDANGRYDQVSGIAEPVKPEWITGIARVRIPYLGWVRLGLADVVRTGPVAAGEVGPVLTGDGRSTADAGVAATRTGPVVGSVDHGPGGESVATGESGTALGTVTSEGVAAREWVRPVTSAPDEANATRPGRTAGSPGAASDGVAG